MNKIKQTGFTLVELATILVIVAILATFAVPSFTGFMERKAVNAAVTELIASISLARSEAMGKGRIVHLCAIQNTNDADKVCGGDNWSQGWLLYFDGDGERLPLQVFQPSRVTIGGGPRGVSEIAPNGMLIVPGADLSFRVLPKSGNVDNGKLLTFSKGSLIRTVEDL